MNMRRVSSIAGALILSVVAGVPLLLAAPTPNKSHAHPNVILITMDTLRADHVGCYGDQEVKTPTMDGLAHDGLLYERAISQVPLTWPSHASLMTGTYPFQNGVQDFTAQPLGTQFRTLAQAFHAAGYATGAVVSSFVLDRSWGLGRGFDFYDDAFAPSSFEQKDLGLVDRLAEESVSRALTWLRRTPRRPFFLWLHLYDPHSPYDPPEPYRTQYKDHLYDGEIAYADHELGRLVAWLKKDGLYQASLIVFVSDHGESLGEHGEREHGFFIYHSTTRVPLIVKPPDGRQAPGRVAAPVEILAVGPTITELAGIHDPIEKQFQAKVLPDGKSAPGPSVADSGAYSETFYPFSSFGWSPLRAIDIPRYQYIDAPQPELYNLDTDPDEANNLAAQQPAMVAIFKEKLKARLQNNPFDRQPAGKRTLTPDAQDKLRALGYMAYRSPAASAGEATDKLADPKTKLWEYNTILEAGDAFRANDFARGEELLAKVRQQDAEIYVVPYMLGEAALRQGKSEEATAQLQEALKLAPDLDEAMTALARALYQQGDAAGARRWLDQALHRNPQNFRAWYELGWLESKVGDKRAAENAYQKALAIQPNFAFAQRDLGLLQFSQNHYAEAAQHLAKATELGLEEATVYNFLGISYSRTDQLAKAVKVYRQALQMDPQLAEAHLNLGYAYQRLGQSTQAKSEYASACKLQPKYCSMASGRAKN
jgi:arylsulfatase A-like enzyme/Flp pilus assembly protein TadD